MGFICLICLETFAAKKNLNRHVSSVHNNQTFNCERCEYSTNQKDKLKQHTESKHFGNKFSCTQSTFSCDRKDSLNRHVKFYHEVEKDPLAPTPGVDWAEDVEQEERVQEQEQQRRRIEPPTEEVQSREDEERTAFNRRIVEKRWYVRGHKDMLEAFKKYKKSIFHSVNLALKRNQIKIDIVIQVTMYRVDKDGNKEEVSQMFYGGPRVILRENQYDEAFDESVKKIWLDFDAWMANGSGWILDRVQNIYLNTSVYEPRGKSYI